MIYELYRLLGERIPNDHSKQVNSEYFVRQLCSQSASGCSVLDLGCGEGTSSKLFRSLLEKLEWKGLDISGSFEVKQRTITDEDFYDFDGINIPFKDDSFDIIYSNQMFEHVRYPTQLLREVSRVLKPSGWLIGSTSHLEAYHSHSLWNYTPYGFSLMLEEAGLSLVEIRPNIDSLTLITRRLLGKPKFFNRWWRKESPLNQALSIVGFVARASPNTVNSVKLLFCGQFCFKARPSIGSSI